MRQAGRWPVTIYPGWLLLGAAASTVALVALTRWVWTVGVRACSGASA